MRSASATGAASRADDWAARKSRLGWVEPLRDPTLRSHTQCDTGASHLRRHMFPYCWDCWVLAKGSTQPTAYVFNRVDGRMRPPPYPSPFQGEGRASRSRGAAPRGSGARLAPPPPKRGRSARSAGWGSEMEMTQHGC